MVLVRGNVMSPVARRNEIVDVVDSEKVQKLARRGVLEYVDEEGEPETGQVDEAETVADAPNFSVDEDDGLDNEDE